MFRLYTGNRLEKLSEALAGVLKTPLLLPLEPETFIVQSSGMSRWLSMEIARYLGVSANNRFLYPNRFINEILQKAIPERNEITVYDPEIMTWQIMKLLPSLIHEPVFEQIGRYLENDVMNRKSCQLAARIADTFDQYLIFRPDMIFEWESEKENHWQAVLWRKLVKENNLLHRAELYNTFLERLETLSPEDISLPKRVSVFGISALPRFHMSVLSAISRFAQINLFLINPCREFWGDMMSARDVKRASQKNVNADVSRDLLYMEQGNRLLADLGTLGRDFINLVQEYDHEIIEFFDDPEEETLLAYLQTDILKLSNSEDENKKRVLNKNDLSVRVHSCHSPMREIEVLYDNLLFMFEQDPDLKPEDILVMTPDIESYAPYIQAVFDTPEDERKYIPYNIADRSIISESSVTRTFMSILNLCGSKLSTSEIISILESGPVRKKFGLTEKDLRLTIKWVNETGIRWGIDANHRNALDLPGFDENTWRFGLKRLLLGYAMDGRSEKMFKEILPYPFVEGEGAAVLGEFAGFLEKLFDVLFELEKLKTLQEWSAVLNRIVDHFFSDDEDSQNELQNIRDAAARLKEIPLMSGFTDSVGIDVIRQYLSVRFESKGFGFRFLTGGITFCAMVPMRSIPFKVICLAGMHMDAFPRQTRSSGFNFITKYPRPGDRSRRNDDLYLFLEALLSARKAFYISYVGQSRIDNAVIPPAVPVSGLLEYIEDNFQIPGNSMEDHVITKHCLQAFSPQYFKGLSKYFSYSNENFQMADRLVKERTACETFMASPLPDSETSFKTIDIEDLVRFYLNPSAFFIKKRMGIYYRETSSTLEEIESFKIESLDKYLLEEKIVEEAVLRNDTSRLKEFFQAGGKLPHGVPGSYAFNKIKAEAVDFSEKILSMTKGRNAETINISLPLSEFEITGKIPGIYLNRMIHYRYAVIKAKDFIKTWIYHIALNCLSHKGSKWFSVLAGKDKKQGASIWEYSLVEESMAVLETLLAYYRKGLNSPLNFYPETSMAYAHHHLEKNRTTAIALREARKKWEGNDYSPGENADPYYHLCYRAKDPLNDDFKKISKDIFEPILKYRKQYRRLSGEI